MAEIIESSAIEIISGLAREKAVKHILNVVDYDNFLCQCIKLHMDFRIGRVFYVLPPKIDIESIVDFSWGYGKGSDNSLPTRILNALKVHPGSVAVFDDVMAEPEKEVIQSSCIANDNEVYHWICETEATELNVAKLVVRFINKFTD